MTQPKFQLPASLSQNFPGTTGASRFRGGIPGAGSADFADNDWPWL